jgi:hypothetical protein
MSKPTDEEVVMTPHEIADQIEKTHAVPRELLDRLAQAVAELASGVIVDAVIFGMEVCEDSGGDVLDVEATAAAVLAEWRDDWLVGEES